MKACVVGSGVTGLTAALLLAKEGHEVHIFEAGPFPAPLLAGFKRQGLAFDTGFHYGGGIGEGGILRLWLKALDLEKYLEFYDANSLERFFFEDGSEYSLQSGAELLPSITRQFPHEKDIVSAMTHLMGACDAVLAQSPYTNPTLYQDPTMHFGSQQSVQERFAALPLPARLKTMLMARCVLYGTPPSQGAWEHYALVSGPYFHSCGTWKGGGAALVKALLQALQAYNVRVQCKSHVVGIEGEKASGVQGVRLEDGTLIPCDQCYFTGHPQQLHHLLPQGLLRPAFYTHVHDMPETLPALMLFAKTTAFEPGQSIYVLTKEHEENADTIFSAEGQESGLYMCTGYPQIPATESRHNEAKTSLPLIVMRFLSPGATDALSEAEYKAYKEKAVQELIALAEKRCPPLRGQWQVLDAATQRTMRHWVTGGTGSLYGIQHTLQDMPLLSATRLQGLFLAGQNILLPGVLGGIISAALAVGFSLGHDTVLEEFRACARG